MWKGTGGCIMMVHSDAPYILQWVHCCDCWFDEWEWSERYKWLDKSVIHNSQIGIRYASHTKDEAKNNWGSSLWKQQMKKEAIALKNVPNYLISKKITCKICTLCIRMNLSHFSTVISFVLSCSSHNSLEDSSFRFKLLNFLVCVKCGAVWLSGSQLCDWCQWTSVAQLFNLYDKLVNFRLKVTNQNNVLLDHRLSVCGELMKHYCQPSSSTKYANVAVVFWILWHGVTMMKRGVMNPKL